MNVLRNAIIIGGIFSSVAIGWAVYESNKIDKQVEKMRAETSQAVDEVNKSDINYIKLQKEIQEQLDRISEKWAKNGIFLPLQ